MEKTTLYMIGNSHIDPVWFWDWDEGMQEVKATFSAALDRLREREDVTFTSTSSAFFEWMEAVAPQLFAEIQEYVAKGRWKLTGGWFLEPDCILPCGEAFVRQGLYAQRYFHEKFGVICRVGSNVDSFGHNPSLPQILKKSGMDAYVFMRPRLETPVFVWEGPDGSQVHAVSLPSEYTTWFYESLKEAIQLAGDAARKAGLSSMPCCFGVGNHGGGPTKENVAAVERLRGEQDRYDLVFGGYEEFFDGLCRQKGQALPVRKEFFDGVNTGCYSMDAKLKRANRLTERRLVCADGMLSMEQLFTGRAVPGQKKEEVKRLWKTLLFCQFHDTLGGTAVKTARDEALRQLGGAGAEAKRIRFLSMEHMMQSVDTRGEGFPLFLYNPTGTDWDGPVALELNWFCKDGLTLLDPFGKEIAYQRVHTEAKARNYNLGGRRGVVFDAKVPAFGFAVYRTCIGESALCDDSRESGGAWLSGGVVLENAYLRAAFDQNGFLCSLLEKETGYEALSGPVSFAVWQDERDSWGHVQDRPYGDTGMRLALESMQLVEEGSHRKVIRSVYRLGGSVLWQEFTLYHNARELEVKNTLFWDREWAHLQMDCPLQDGCTFACQETAYGTFSRKIGDDREYSMHRFVDVYEKGQAGLCVANDGKYAFSLFENTLSIPFARSAIYAQGNGKNWYNPVEGYEYTDMGKQTFTLLLRPHGNALLAGERHRLAERCEKPLLHSTDNCHEGAYALRCWQGLSVEQKNVELGCVKAAEDNDGLVLRLIETEGKATEGKVRLGGQSYPYTIGAYEILTLLVVDGTCRAVNLLEWET